MPLQFYNVLHIAGVMALFFALGGVTLHVLSGGNRDYPGRKLVAILHGVALVVILVSGFGMLARLGISFNAWAGVKLTIWFIMGALLFVIYRMPHLAKFLWWLIPLLGALTAYIAVYKPI